MDLLHESFIKIFQKIGRYESGTALPRVDAPNHRQHGHRPIPGATCGGAPKISIPLTAYLVTRRMYSPALALRKSWRRYSKLPPTYRTIFNLYVVEGYSHKEIGAQLEITDSTSRSNLVKSQGEIAENAHRPRPLGTILMKDTHLQNRRDSPHKSLPN